MALPEKQVAEKLKNPTKKKAIAKAIKHENRLKFHTESHMEFNEMAQTLTQFLEWVKSLIPKDKYNIFVQLFKLPTPNIQLVNKIFNELERVFDSKNPVETYQFEDATLRDDWEWFKTKHLRQPEIWRGEVWEAVKSKINSVIIIDLPAEQVTDRPAPYFYLLDIAHVIDYGLDRHGNLEYIIFKQGDGKIAVFDDASRRVYTVKDNELISIESEVPHDLGYCPAAFFWSDNLNSEGVKKSPLSADLANLDWLLFFSISKRHLDLYAPYPIYSAYAADCDFRNNETGDYCDGGFLRDSAQNYRMYNNGTIEQCPACADKRLAGVGSFIEIPVPMDGDPDLSDPVKITSIDSASLKYNVDEEARIKHEIFTSVVGQGSNTAAQEKTSLSEVQVIANFEGKISVLNNLKGNLEAAQKFINDTICRLRYGASFIDSSISLGTKFYIYTVDELYKQYKQAKENGATEAELDAIREDIILTEYKNNPQQLQRMLILRHLEPLRHNTRDEVLELYSKELVDKISMKIKINFSTFIDRFERENINIIEFGSQLEFDKKINIIKKELERYGKESESESTGKEEEPGRTSGE